VAHPHRPVTSGHPLAYANGGPPAIVRPSIFSLLSIYRVFGTSAEFIHLFLFVSRRTFVRTGVVRGVAARPPPPGVDTSGEVLLRTLFDNFNKKTSTLIGKVQCWLVRSSLERCYEGGKAPGCFFPSSLSSTPPDLTLMRQLSNNLCTRRRKYYRRVRRKKRNN
jgi:hypothetical protein